MNGNMVAMSEVQMPIWFNFCGISDSDHKFPGKIPERSAWQVRQAWSDAQRCGTRAQSRA